MFCIDIAKFASGVRGLRQGDTSEAPDCDFCGSGWAKQEALVGLCGLSHRAHACNNELGPKCDVGHGASPAGFGNFQMLRVGFCSSGSGGEVGSYTSLGKKRGSGTGNYDVDG